MESVIKFLKKHKSGLISLFVALIIFGLMVLIIYFSNEDKKKLFYSNDIEIQENDNLYHNELNNIFNEDWYNAVYQLGKWNTGDDEYPEGIISTDDLFSSTDDIGKYFVSLSNAFNGWNDNFYYYSVGDFPFFRINFQNDFPVYQNFSLLLNNMNYYSNMYIDLNIQFGSGSIVKLTNIQPISSNGIYLVLNNTDYYNYSVLSITFKSGISIDTLSDDIGFYERFGSSYTYSPYINITNGIDSATYQDLYNRYNDLEGKYDALQSAYNYNENQYLTLSQNYATLLEQYNTLLNQTDYSFQELFWSISAVPFNFIASGFNVNILGANIGAIITGLFTASIVIWLFKKLFR